MADPTSTELQRLILSAADLKRLTSEQEPGEPWPDALIEDYLNILRDLILLADQIDSNAGEIFRELTKLFQITGDLGIQIAKNRGGINKNSIDIRDNALNIQLNSGNIKKVEQLVHAW